MMADGCNDILERQFVWILGEACRNHGEQQMVVLRYIAARYCNIWLQKQNFFYVIVIQKTKSRRFSNSPMVCEIIWVFTLCLINVSLLFAWFWLLHFR